MYDALIVGARCAGSPTAMLLARKGYRVLLVDRATFPSDAPRNHVIHAPGIARLKQWGLLDKVIASNDLESWSEATSKRWVGVINSSIDAGILQRDTRLGEPQQH